MRASLYGFSIFDEDLAAGKFKLYLSPIKNASEELIGVEADSKWKHSEKGLLNSEEYVSVLEKFGIIYKLDKYIWTEAIKVVSKWNKEHEKQIRLLLQVSVKDSYYLDLYETFVELVTENNCSPDFITLEFLEESISQDFREINNLFKKMQNYGFRILFNKFGHGRSSLNLLKETHLNAVKIDSRFVEDADSEVKTEKILEFIIELSNMLGLNPCISGVDSQQQFKFLNKLRVQGYQGIYCGNEMTPEEFSAVFYS